MTRIKGRKASKQKYTGMNHIFVWLSMWQLEWQYLRCSCYKGIQYFSSQFLSELLMTLNATNDCVSAQMKQERYKVINDPSLDFYYGQCLLMISRQQKERTFSFHLWDVIMFTLGRYWLSHEYVQNHLQVHRAL